MVFCAYIGLLKIFRFLIHEDNLPSLLEKSKAALSVKRERLITALIILLLFIAGYVFILAPGNYKFTLKDKEIFDINQKANINHFLKVLQPSQNARYKIQVEHIYGNWDYLPALALKLKRMNFDVCIQKIGFIWWVLIWPARTINL